jgi:hypothetical protein
MREATKERKPLRTVMATKKPCPAEGCYGGTVEYIEDLWNWSSETHTTREWSEPCDECQGTGEVRDDDDC